MLRGARPVRGIVAWQTERELSLALTKGDQNEWLAKLLRQSAEKVERDSDRPLGPGKTRPDRLRHFG